ncbi:MAG: YqjD family protein [Pseudomonadota bacterium]
MTMSTENTVASQEKLVSDMKAVIADAEDMLKATADQTGEKIASLRARIQERLHAARVRLADAEAVLREKTRAMAKATDAYVHENPWKSIGVAAGVGFLVGFILGRR